MMLYTFRSNSKKKVEEKCTEMQNNSAILIVGDMME